MQATGQYSLDNHPGKCNMICANGAQLNVLLHPLVIYMMKTRLDSQVAAKLTVKLYNVVQLFYDSLSAWVSNVPIVSGAWGYEYKNTTTLPYYLKHNSMYLYVQYIGKPWTCMAVSIM